MVHGIDKMIFFCGSVELLAIAQHKYWQHCFVSAYGLIKGDSVRHRLALLARCDELWLVGGAEMALFGEEFTFAKQNDIRTVVFAPHETD